MFRAVTKQVSRGERLPATELYEGVSRPRRETTQPLSLFRPGLALASA